MSKSKDQPKEQKNPPALQSALDAIKKAYGAEAIILNNASIPGVEFCSSQCMGLDRALGGGWARGRMIEVLGPESCIAHGSFIPYEVWNGETRSNHKGGTIERLYERFTGDLQDHTPIQGRCFQNNDCDFYVKSVDDEGKIIRNKVLDVVKTGRQQCFQLQMESGEILFCTKEHKFMTPNGFLPLKTLEVGDILFVHNNTRVKGRKNSPNRPEVYVKYHPNLPTKQVTCNKTGNTYTYYRGQKSRMIFEADLNYMSLKEYTRFLNTGTVAEIGNLKLIPNDLHVHHKDENFLNNSIENLELVDPSFHGQIHTKDRLRNLSFVAVPSKIIDIIQVGYHETYDIKCAYPYNNYIAEGIVVHNSGKSTLALHAVAQHQKEGRIAAFIDMEHALDPLYTEALGVDMNTVLVSQPNSGEEALDILELLLKSGELGLIVLDSVAALVPKAEIEGKSGDSHMGLQARLMSQAMRKLSGAAHRTNTTVMWINQLRQKIGIVFGNPEVSCGGNALKFYASQRVDIRRIGGVKPVGEEKNETVQFIANRTRAKVVKNKVAPPFRLTEFDIVYGKGIDIYADLLECAVTANIVEQSGSWYSFRGTRIGQGKANICTYLKENENIAHEIRSKL